MTVFTAHFGVRPFEGPTRALMVESGFSSGAPIDECMLGALMLFVTQLTIALVAQKSSVKAKAFAQSRLQLFVTRQTRCLAQLLPSGVTLRALREAAELGMGLRQLPR